MNRLAPPPANAIQHGTDFYVPPALNHPTASDLKYLLPGETEWWGPYPTSGEFASHYRWDLRDTKEFAKKLHRSGLHLQVQGVGPYIRTRRLAEGPTDKLSDWRQLAPGAKMLVNPAPTADDIERAITRGKYMRNNGYGRFRSWTEDSGALWVSRLEVGQ